jgi:hypothetical protein
LPDIAILPDGAVFHYMGKMPYFRSGTDLTRLVDVGGFVDEIVAIFHRTA